MKMMGKHIAIPILTFLAACNVLRADDARVVQTNSIIGETRVVEMKPSGFRIDGSLDDWKTNGTVWVNPPKPSNDDFDFDITECRVSSDKAYLYLFLRFSPSIGERFKRLNPDGKVRSFGNLGYFYFRTDRGRSRGAQGLGVRRELIGANKMVAVMSGTEFLKKLHCQP